MDKKKKAKAFLDSYTTAIFNKYETNINDYLESCGAGFRIEEVKTIYPGGKASVIYKLSIRGTTVDLSMPKSAKCCPCFNNTLSEGDKSTLAFIFFLAKLDREPNISNKIVVFDDPVSSLDAHRRSFTQQQIIRLSQCCKQVIILTHDLYLAHQVFDNARVEISTLQIKRKGESSIIEKWDIETDIRSDYFKNYDVISEYLERGSRDSNHLVQVARCIRPLLEGYLRIKFPKEFSQSEWLGNLWIK
jgi:wobble nucleotide-excising tRNase